MTHLLIVLALSMTSTAVFANCSDVPASVRAAFEDAKAFTLSCSTANIGDDKMIAINDYSGSSTPPKMFIFTKSGNCQMEMPITWGVGSDKSGELSACSTKDSNKTPPGFHITAPHTGGTAYSEADSIGLAGLSGQKSLEARGILIHRAENPGTATSIGCTGVPNDKFEEVKKMLGYGSLVHNFFGKPPKMKCDNQAGADDKCEPEAAARTAASGKAPPSSGSDSSQRASPVNQAR